MLQITYYGHNCFLFKSEIAVLMDPFISDNPLASAVSISDIKCDYIIITHGHGDHLANAIEIAKNNDAKIIALYEVALWLEKQGYANVHPVGFGGTFSFDETSSAKYVQAMHSSSMPDGTYGGQAKTPNSNKLAAEGMKFERCFQAAPMCSPTRHNIYTGIFPVKSGA